MYNGDPAIDLIHYIWAQEKYDERTDNAWVFLALVTGLPVVDEEENSASDDDADNDTDADADADAESGSADSDAADNDADADANADADSDSDPDSADSNAELGDSAAADPITADSADAPRPANDTDVATVPDSAADAAAAAGSAIADSAADATASFTTTNFPGHATARAVIARVASITGVASCASRCLTWSKRWASSTSSVAGVTSVLAVVMTAIYVVK